jgi:electron transport complex protein RnfG
MSQAELMGPTTAASSWQMYRAMVGVALLSGLLIVTVFQVTWPVIERKTAEALRRAIFQVVPGAQSSATFRLEGEERFLPLEGEGAGLPVVHAGYDDQRQLIGLAIEASGMGYQDVIRVLYGYSFTEKAIVGIRVLESKETPGLGDKIETDESFQENFRRLDVSLSADGTRVENAITAVKQGTKEHPWEVDGITGATISSVAIANLLNKSAAYWVPLLSRRLDDFRKAD